METIVIAGGGVAGLELATRLGRKRGASRRVILMKRSRSSVSRWMLMRRKPASYNAAACCLSRTPLVVSARS